MLSECIDWLVLVVRSFFAWLVQWNIFSGISYLSFIVGVFLVYLIIDNFLMKGK